MARLLRAALMMSLRKDIKRQAPQGWRPAKQKANCCQFGTLESTSQSKLDQAIEALLPFLQM
jgi:hypothetical protein